MSRRRSRVIEKRRRRAKDDLRAERQRRQTFDRILNLMGLDDLRSRFGEKLPSLLSRTFPRPRVLPDLARASDDELVAKAKELGRTLDDVAIRIGHEDLSHADFFTVCVGLCQFCSGWKEISTSLDERRTWEHALDQLTAFVKEHEPEMMDELYEAIFRFLATNSRLDGPIYTVKHRASFEGTKFVCTTTLRRTIPDSILIGVGGHPRRAFRCGSAEDYESGEIAWVGWDAEVLGPGTIGRVPIYIQSHALEQAHKRLGTARDDNLLHHFLAESLREPRISPGRDGHLLVEVRLDELRVGYLLAKRLPDKVLVRTFLLITMLGTPEGARLHERLRMSRADLEYLELDNFAKLAFTDLLKDDEIAEIFRQCGCEGLLSLARRDFPFEIRGGYADQFKTYFGRTLTPPLDVACRVPHPASGQPIQP